MREGVEGSSARVENGRERIAWGFDAILDDLKDKLSVLQIGL